MACGPWVWLGTCWGVPSAYTPPVRRHPRVVAGFLAVVVLAVVVGVLGGWSRDTADDVRVVEPGADVRVTPFRVRLDSAEALYEVDGTLAEQGRAFVVVDGQLSLDDDESVGAGIVDDLYGSDLADTYSVFGDPEKDAAPQVTVAEDGSSLLGIGPGITYRVRLVYVLDEAAVPDRMTVTLRRHIRRDSSLDGTPGWFDPETFARVSLDVAELPAERPPAEDDL